MADLACKRKIKSARSKFPVLIVKIVGYFYPMFQEYI